MFGQMKLSEPEVGHVVLSYNGVILREGSLQQCTATALRFDEVSTELADEFKENRRYNQQVVELAFVEGWDSRMYRR